MTDIVSIAPVSLAGPRELGAMPDAPRLGDAARFEHLGEDGAASVANYARSPDKPQSDAATQWMTYANSVDQHLHTALKDNIQSMTKLDFSDPMSIVRIMEVQADIFSATMELQLAAKLADSGRHFTSTLFQNQG
jgi:hypothetical protein